MSSTPTRATLLALVSGAALLAAAHTTTAQPPSSAYGAGDADRGYAPDTYAPPPRHYERPSRPARTRAPTPRYDRPSAPPQDYPSYSRSARGAWPQYPAYAPPAYGYPQGGRTDTAPPPAPTYPAYGGWGAPWSGPGGYPGAAAYYPYPAPPMAPPVDPGSGDDDSDGVINRSDRCPETPADEEAGVFGCAVGESFVVEGIDFDAEGGPSKDSRVKLDELADMLMASPGQQIEISGHTDATDDIGRDQWISAYRAIVVMKYLADRGVIVEDMIARAYGGTRPIASNDTEEGRAANRRIEIVRIQ